GPSGVNTILGALLKQVSNNVETLGIMGDESQGGSDDYSRLLRANDGWHVQTAAGTGTHQLNAASKQISWRLLSDMVAALPTRYRRNLQRDYRFIMSPNAVIRLLNEVQSRQTDFGDSLYTNDG